MQAQGGAAQCVGTDALLGQARAVVGHADALDVDAQVHRRRLLCRRQDGLPVLRVIALQPLGPPARVVPARHRVVLHGRGEGRALAQVAPQAGVDEGGVRAQGAIALGGFDGLIEQGEGFVGRAVGRLRQRQAGAQQGIDGGRWGAARQLGAQRLRQPEPAQHMKRQRLGAGAQQGIDARQFGRQRTPRPHARHQPRTGLQLAPQGQGLRGGGRHQRPSASRVTVPAG